MGPVLVTCAHATRRTADVQHLGCIILMRCESDAAASGASDDAAALLHDVQGYLFEEIDVRGEAAQLSRNLLMPATASVDSSLADADTLQEALSLLQSATTLAS